MARSVVSEDIDQAVLNRVSKVLMEEMVERFHGNPVELIVGLFDVGEFLQELLGIHLDDEFKRFTKSKIRKQIELDKVRDSILKLAESEDARAEHDISMFG